MLFNDSADHKDLHKHSASPDASVKGLLETFSQSPGAPAQPKQTDKRDAFLLARGLLTTCYISTDAPPPADGIKASGDKPNGADKAAGKAVENGAEKAPELLAEQQKCARYLQTTLVQLLPVYTDIKLAPDLNPEQQHEKLRKQVTEMRAQLQKEKDAGVFGPATQEAYKNYVNFLQKVVPETIRELDTLGRPIPPGSPIPLESDRYGRSIDPQLYKALMADERLVLALQLEPNLLPNNAQLDKLDDTVNWLGLANDSAADARNMRRDEVIDRLLREQGLPEGWKKQPGDDPNTWRNSAEEMIDLASRTRNYIEAMQSLYKSSRDSDFPIELPLGTKLTVVDADGKSHTIKDNELVDPYVRKLLKDGTITEVSLDIPKNLVLGQLANERKCDRLRDWLTTHGDKIDQALAELKKIRENPDAVIMFGDQEVRNGKALFNEKGEFLKIVNGSYPAKPGEQIKDMNLVGYDFNVEKTVDGKYKVSQTIQAENAPFWAYQNIRALGIENVGKPMNLGESKLLDGEDFVPVRSEDRIQLVKAKNLQSFKDNEEFHYRAEKSVAITLDAAMLASGGIEVGAAVKGARIAALGAEGAVKLTAREAAWEIGKGIVRIGVAGSGIFNNAGARDTEWGRNIETARGIYFLADISQGVVRGGWNLVRAGKATEVMTSAEKVHSIIRGKEAVNGVAAIKGIPWISHVHRGTEFAFAANEFASAPIIINDLIRQVAIIQAADQPNPAKDALIQVGDGRGMQRAEKGIFDPDNAKSLQAALTVLDGYKNTLTSGRTKEVSGEISTIFDMTKKLLGPDANEALRERYCQELLKKSALSPEEIALLEIAQPTTVANFRLTNEQLCELRDPEKRKNWPKPVAELYETFMARRDKDVIAAAEVAMLYLSRDKDGKIKPAIAKMQGEIPAYGKDMTRTDSNGLITREHVDVAARTAEQKITAQDVVLDLQRDLEDPKLGNRGIVTGEVLTRIGALTHQQYGGVLINVLKDPDANPADKLRALADAAGPRMAAIVDGVRYLESQPVDDTSKVLRERAAGHSHGLTSEAMLAQLERTAGTDKDQDVRAMSAALLYGLRERNVERRAELLSGFNTMLEQNGKEGEVAKKIHQFFKNELLAQVPDKPAAQADSVRESKLYAALSLALITDKNDVVVQKELTSAIARSFSNTNIALSNRVLDALMPDRMTQLQKDDAKLANEMRLAAVKLLVKPESSQQESEEIKLLAKLEPLLKNGDMEVRRQLESQLQGLLRKSDLNPSYAMYFPSLRASAIETLAKLGSQNSLDLILSHASAQPSIKIGNDVFPAGEESAAVRKAALRALDSLHDTRMRLIVNAMIDKETDPNVASYLRDIRMPLQRLEPDSREYKELYERTRADRIAFGKMHPYLKDFEHEQAKTWLKDNSEFSLLDHSVFMERAKQEVDKATGTFFRLTSLSETIHLEEQTKLYELLKQRREQFASLITRAGEGSEDGNKAKMALYYIAVQNGSILGDGNGVGTVQSAYNPSVEHRFPDIFPQAEAARALQKLAESKCQGKDVLANILKDGLTKNKEIPSYVTASFFDGWRTMGKAEGKAEGEYYVPRAELARVTAEALQMESSRLPGAQYPAIQEDMVKDLEKYGHRMVLPVMQAMIDEPGHVSDGVRKAAQAMVDRYTHSTKLMWEETNPDQVSTSAQRAQRLKTALTDSNNAEATVQEIFNAYKDYKIKDVKDPGLSQLQLAMNDSSERVRLAAVRILINSDLPDGDLAKTKALETLIEMTLRTSHSEYHNEAYDMLRGLKIDKSIILVCGQRCYELEKCGNETRVKEFTKQPDGPKSTLSGMIYPGGGSVRWLLNDKGVIVQTWEDGINWQRRMDGDKPTSEWKNAISGGVWNGENTVLPNGEFHWRSTGSDKLTRRHLDGTTDAVTQD